MYFTFMLIVFTGSIIIGQDRIYVGTTENPFTSIADHSSWGTATSDLQAAINALTTNGGEVWIERGTYYPTESYYTTDVNSPYYDATAVEARCVSFMMRDGVAIYGGFNGESELSARTNFAYGEANATVLSGDLGADGIMANNAYHVVYASDNTALSASLSDVIVTGGNANGESRNSRGGGIQTRHGGTYNNVTVIGNEAYRGAGIYAYGGGVFNYCFITENLAKHYSTNQSAIGGGIYMHLGNGVINNCYFYNNVSDGSGGGIGSTSGSIVQCRFVNNVCNSKGGAVYTYQDIVDGVPTSGGVYQSCLMANNTAWVDGGGIFADASGTWLNCTVVRNKSNDSGGGIYAITGANFTNLVVWGNNCITSPTNEIRFSGGGVYTNCAVGGLTDLNTGVDMLALNLVNTEADGPGFIAPSGIAGRGETPGELDANRDADWQIGLNSILRNGGLADLSGLNLGDYDLANNPRIVKDRIDIGAYEIQYYEVDITSSGNGTISAASPIALPKGGDTTIELTPDANHFVRVFTVGGADRLNDLVDNAGVLSYTINDIQADVNIEVQFHILTQHSINITGDVGGDVTPASTQQVYEGDNFEVRFDPSVGYGIRSVLVDDVEQESNLIDNQDGTFSYIINNVSADHTIEVDFALKHTITFMVSLGGTSSHTGQVTILEGNTMDAVFTPGQGYKLRSLLQGLLEVIGNITDNGNGTYSYQIAGVTEDIDFAVEFSPYHNVTVNAGAGGIVGVPQSNEVYENDELLVSVTPDQGYKISSILLGGVDVSSQLTDNGDGTFEFQIVGVTEDTELTIEFMPFYNVTVESGMGGAADLAGVNEVYENESLMVTLMPEQGYRVSTVTLDGVDITAQLEDIGGGSYSYTVADVTADALLSINYLRYYVVTLNHSSGGVVSPFGSMDVDDGTSVNITITPDKGYEIASATLGGADVMSSVVDNADGTYTYLIQGLADDATFDVQFTVITSIGDTESDEIRIYPNPADVFVNVAGGLSVVYIYDTSGKLIRSYHQNSLSKPIAVGDLPAGIYLLKYVTNSGNEGVQKLILKR